VHTAWLPYWSFGAAYRTVVANADLFRTASPFWYAARSCTSIVAHDGAGSAWAVDGLHARGVAVVPTIASHLGPAATVACLGDPRTRRRHVAAVLRIARSHGYDGIDLDYEHLALTRRPAMAARVRDAYTAFVEQLCAVLRAEGRQCVVTVMPRVDDRVTVWRDRLIPAVYDYEALGAAATRVRVMAYDQHAPNTRPGPIAGLPWVRAVARYAGSTVPPGKVELGVPLYGRDWSGGTASTVTARAARALAARHGATVTYDGTQRAPWFRYRVAGRTHTVWFSDAASVRDRGALAAAEGLAGLALWAAGQEEAATWPALRRAAASRSS